MPMAYLEHHQSSLDLICFGCEYLKCVKYSFLSWSCFLFLVEVIIITLYFLIFTPKLGVYISKYADCLDLKRWYDGKTGYIVLLKLTKVCTLVENCNSSTHILLLYAPNTNMSSYIYISTSGESERGYRQLHPEFHFSDSRL